MLDCSEKVIVFHQDKVLLHHQSILIDREMIHQDICIVRKLSFDAINLIELISSEEVSLRHHDHTQWITFKEALHVIHEQEFAKLARGISLLHWDRNHQFCGQCGKATNSQPDAFERQCPDCRMNFYPRISPAVIVLIYRNDEILMARSPHFPPGVYALIAGFVEAGEALEETIHREVFEEVGIKIKNLSYHSSQPWPFPDSLMIGFTAEYDSGEILIDETEIEDAGWYRYDQLPGLPSFRISIGFSMIERFRSKMLSHRSEERLSQ